MLVHAELLSAFARGGGGGSGGGSGGGGIVLVGYVPMHFLGRYFRQHNINKVLSNVVVWVVAVVYFSVLIAAFHGLGFIMAIGVPLGAAAGLYGLFDKLKRNRKAERALQAAAATDGSWDVAAIKNHVKTVFERFQYDWSVGDTESMRRYLSPWYHYHISLMMMAMAQASRVNRVTNVKIFEQNIQSVNDVDGTHSDGFTMGVMATANDQLIDTRDEQVLFTDNNTFVEYWHFKRNDKSWILDGIDQATANLNAQNTSIKQFAQQNQMCYSLDWGWLLLPRRGYLFGKGKFGVSDINNHVIGVYNNMLVQIYNFVPNTRDTSKNYLIAQVQLPKSYGEILVTRKKSFLHRMFNGTGLQKISMEWMDFNKVFEVHASTAEGPTAFELLHPAFMEKLEAQPFEINMNVVDNVVYFFAEQKNLKAENYPVMLSILKEAFKQMKM